MEREPEVSTQTRIVRSLGKKHQTIKTAVASNSQPNRIQRSNAMLT